MGWGEAFPEPLVRTLTLDLPTKAGSSRTLTRSLTRRMTCQDLGLSKSAPGSHPADDAPPPADEGVRPPDAAPPPQRSRWRDIGGLATAASSSAGAGSGDLEALRSLERLPSCAKCRPAAGWAPPPREMPPGWNSARTKLAAVSAFQGSGRARSEALASATLVELVKTPLGLGLSLDRQNRVVSITPASQAERCGGFAVGDRLLSLNGQPLRKGLGAFKAQLGTIAVGTKLQIQVDSREEPPGRSSGPPARAEAWLVRRALAEHGAREP